MSQCLFTQQTINGGVPVKRVMGGGMLGWHVVDTEELHFYEKEEEMELEVELVLADDQI